MKKLSSYYLFITAFIIPVIMSCNGSGDDNTESKKDSASSAKSLQARYAGSNCTGLANIYFVKKQDALDMITHFKKEFHGKAGLPVEMKKFKDSIWIDSSVIKGFSDFLDINIRDYDGVRIVNVAYANDSSGIFLVPTTAAGAGHEEKWNAYVPIPGAPTFRNYNTDTGIVNPMSRKFKTLFRRQTDPEIIGSTAFDSLSAKIWLSSCVFHLLADTIQASKGKLDGVKIYFAAYKQVAPNRVLFQKYANQSTIILVPTTPNAAWGRHKPDWDAVKTKFKTLNWAAPDPGGYNHGELCPQICN